jgi:putative oxidoreductase
MRVSMAALFLFAAFGKLTSRPMMVQEFDIVGLGQWFRYFTGIVEVVGAAALPIAQRAAPIRRWLRRAAEQPSGWPEKAR